VIWYHFHPNKVSYRQRNDCLHKIDVAAYDVT